MPIYDYRCKQCGHEFELLVLRSTVGACPMCRSEALEQLLSGFSVSSESVRQSNIVKARRKFAASKDLRDKNIAEAEEIKEHQQG